MKANPFLHLILQAINKRTFNPKFKERVFNLLGVIEKNGGPDALKQIKNKIPAYEGLI